MTIQAGSGAFPPAAQDTRDGPAAAAPPAPAERRAHPLLRWGAVALGVVVLGLLFASYLSPDMAFTLMTQAWSCL